jgi:signal peptide peptidase SppA
MSIQDIVSGPWAITPTMLIQIQSIYSRYVNNEPLDMAAIEKKIGKPLNSSNNSIMSEQQGVAVIDIQGTIAKKVNMLSNISGGTSTQLVSDYFQKAINDPNIKGIVLNVDSPGGTVDGTSEFADSIFQARGKKPIVAFSDGMIASAAYWIASACDSIYISGDTNPVGSIGVVAAHKDMSGAEAQRGVKTTEIAAGNYKRVAGAYAPLTVDGKAEIQGQVDYLYSVFVDCVARNRRVSTTKVLSDMADGRVFLGKQSIDNGLADGVSTLSKIITDMQNKATYRPTVVQVVSKPTFAVSNNAAERAAALAAIAEGGSVSTHGDLPERQFMKSFAERQQEAEAIAKAQGGGQ